MARVSWKGVTLDDRTRDQMDELCRLVGRDIQPTQGSYNRGGVAASAGTHDGGGVIDWDIDGLSNDQVWDELATARSLGLIAWKRTPAQGFSLHVHAVSDGCPDLSAGAAAQVRDYYNGLNGLASRKPDDGPPGYIGRTWETYLALKAKEQAAKEAVMAGNLWFMQAANDGKIWAVKEDCSGKFYLPSPDVAADVGFILKASGGKVLGPPQGVPKGDLAGGPVWTGIRPETLNAIPTL